MTGHIQHSLHCRRFDLSTPALIFGGLFLAATTVRSLDISPASGMELETLGAIEEVKVLADQPTALPIGYDLLMMDCEAPKRSHGIQAIASKRNAKCMSKSSKRASNATAENGAN